ncbi:MAG: LysM peptidoglycan-binding domain-containing protein [Thalassobaculum sp.]|uniref:LysM peptidoglycan-binding domain-containing protein n=1 Tax=Thalassobaculum sp. TaxID=2022740 RepID=UPI0032EC348F
MDIVMPRSFAPGRAVVNRSEEPGGKPRRGTGGSRRRTGGIADQFGRPSDCVETARGLWSGEHYTACGLMVAKPVTVGVVGVVVLASALVLNYFVLPGEEAEPVARAPSPTSPAPPSPKRPDATAKSTDRTPAGAPQVPPPATGQDRQQATVSTPSFDVVRVDPDGNTVIAGRGAPNTDIAILDGSKEIGRVTTDNRGEWVFVPPSKLEAGERVLSLKELTDQPRQSDEAVVLVIPEKGKDIAGRATDGASVPLAVVVPRNGDGSEQRVATRVLQAPAAGPLASNGTPGSTSAGGAAATPAPGASSAGASSAGSSGTGASDTRTSAAAGAAVGAVAGAAAGSDTAVSGAATSGSGPAVSAVVAGKAPQETAVPALTAAAPAAGVSASAPVPAEPPSAAPIPADPPSAKPSSAEPSSAAPTPAAPAAVGTQPGEPKPAAPSQLASAAPAVSAYPEPAAPAAADGVGQKDVAVDVIDYDDKGDVVFSGRADPGSKVEVFIDNRKVGDTGADAEGRWTMRPAEPVAPGSYQLRVDKVTSTGAVEARVAFPFVRADPLTELPDNRLVVIQPGNNLWRIATRVYGTGVRYVEIFDANKDQILDPDLIYPGQVFGLPRVN